MSTAFTETSDYFEFSVQGDIVSRCCFDYAFTIQLQDTYLLIVVEQEFSLTVGGASHLLQPPAGLAAGLEVLHKSLLYLKAFKTTGRLVLALAPDIVLTVGPNPNYEAWHITGKEGPLVVCMPGGKLATWLPEEPQ